MTPQSVDSPDLWAGLPTLEDPHGEDDTAPDVWEDPIPLTGRRERPRGGVIRAAPRRAR